jgi:hypothetical protein
MLTKEAPARVIGDKVYGSVPLDVALADKGIEMIAPTYALFYVNFQKKFNSIIDQLILFFLWLRKTNGLPFDSDGSWPIR